jgi:hypothetical protein
MQINDQGTFYVEGEYKAGDIILTAGDWELVADVDGYKKYAFGYEPEDFPELVTNGTFDTGIDGWSGNFTWESGAIRFNSAAKYEKGYGPYFSVEAGSVYKVSIDVLENTTPYLLVIVRGTGFTQIVLGKLPTSQSYKTYTFVANSSALVRLEFAVQIDGTNSALFDNISVKLAHPKSGDTIQLGNGHHKDFRYYPYKLSATDIQELTR